MLHMLIRVELGSDVSYVSLLGVCRWIIISDLEADNHKRGQILSGIRPRSRLMGKYSLYPKHIWSGTARNGTPIRHPYVK